MKTALWQLAFGLVSLALAAGSAWAAGDAARGADVFKENCAGCHSPERGQILVGPSLYSVVGRSAASEAGFPYSNAMKSSGVVWTPDKLMAYLKAPRRFIPGVKMYFPGLNDETDCANVIAFLSTLSEQAQSAPQATAATVSRTSD
jgi:cytochrome c